MGRLNERIAERLREAADLLDQQDANPFRTAAYRRAADTLISLDESIAGLLARAGVDGLTELPGIGRSLAAAIAEMAHTGRWRQLERLRGEVDPQALFQAMPGVGPELARRIHVDLDVDTLEELEVAAHDGRLEALSGIGPRRAAMLRATLARMLARTRPVRQDPHNEPDVAVLLDVDREYRDRAGDGSLPTIAPRRFNPQGEAWLPVLHTERGTWRFTALFSNTGRAHDLGRTRDWVVVAFHTDHEPEGQRTIVTETHGSLLGRRVVRGREAECQACYLSPATAPRIAARSSSATTSPSDS
jgi:putative hydrolase